MRHVERALGSQRCNGQAPRDIGPFESLRIGQASRWVHCCVEDTQNVYCFPGAYFSNEVKDRTC